MSYEVEQKFPVESLDPLRRTLAQWGVALRAPVEQVDCYYNHPCRDFAATDEALRLRHVGAETWITYKGPKQDEHTKTRREIELALPDPAEADGLLEALGFGKVAEVRKQRQVAQLDWQEYEVEIALDDVAGLGRFVELEVTTREESLDEARSVLSDLARALGLEHGERRSYLELLFENKDRG